MKINFLRFSFFVWMGIGAGSFFASVSEAAAQVVSRDSAVVQLDEVEIAGHRAKSAFAEVGRVVQVFTRQDLQAMPIQSVDEFLEQALHVDIRQRGPLGVQSDISIRGGSFDQVMVLLNGINVTDPQTGHFNMNIPVDLSSVQRIEVLEGPGARIYGPNAFSGVVNIVTDSQKGNFTKAHLSGGAFGYLQANVNQGLAVGNWQNYFSAGVSRADGYVENTDFVVRNFYYRSRFKLDQLDVDFQIGHQGKDFGALTFYSARYPDQYEENRTTLSSLTVSGNHGKIQHQTTAYWRRNTDFFDLIRSNAGNKPNHHLTDVWGAGHQLVVPWKYGQTSVGIDLRSENIWSTVLGNPLRNPKPIPGDTAHYKNFYSRTNASAFLEHSYQYQKLTVTAGLMLNYNSGLDWKARVFSGVDVSYWVNSHWKLFATANNALRLPTFTDLFYADPVQVGNPDLKPEKAFTIEGGVRQVGKGYAWSVSGFYKDGKDLIDWGKAEGEALFQSRNISSLKSSGIQVDARFELNRLWPEQSYLRLFRVGYAFTHQDKNALAEYESKFVLDYLKHKMVVQFEHKIVSRLMMHWQAAMQDRNGEFVRFATNEVIGYEPFALLDARLFWDAPQYRIYLEARNLLDTDYEDVANVPQPGIWVKAGVQIAIHYR